MVCLTKGELKEYENSLKSYRDIKNSIDTAKEGGREEGHTEEKFETARKLIAKGMSVDFITDVTGLTVDEIRQL